MTHEANFAKDEHFLALLRKFVDKVQTPGHGEISFFRYFAALAYHDVVDEVASSSDVVAAGVLSNKSDSVADLSDVVASVADENGNDADDTENDKSGNDEANKEKKAPITPTPSFERLVDEEKQVVTKRRSVSDVPPIIINSHADETPTGDEPAAVPTTPRSALNSMIFSFHRAMLIVTFRERKCK